MAMRAPKLPEVRPGHLTERRSIVPSDDPLFVAMMNAPLETEPLTEEDRTAIEEFGRIMKRGQAPRRP
jgi:hypothetical protein